MKSPSMLKPPCAGVAVLAADEMVHQVAELVQEHDHVPVLHQARIPRRAAGEIAHQRAVGQLRARARRR